MKQALWIVALAAACAKPIELNHPPSSSNIKHLVVIVQENHTFDSYFGRYCEAPTGSNPTCTDGATCCERGPDTAPGTTIGPVELNDALNGSFDPNHEQQCELREIGDGGMDHFLDALPTCEDPGSVGFGSPCGCQKNFAYATGAEVQPYWTLAKNGALADRYFQPIAGQSSSNDMYLARAAYVFTDNDLRPDALGNSCGLSLSPSGSHTDKTVGDLLSDANLPWAWYGEGYQAVVDAKDDSPPCPLTPDRCATLNPSSCIYDPGDNPFQYYTRIKDSPEHNRDYEQLAKDIAARRLPAVSYVKPFGFRSEHPGSQQTISEGAAFVTRTIDAVESSAYRDSTLILVTYDEGGGYFDHVTPPPTSTADRQPYGTRIPLIAVGPFARRNAVSHVTLEHSSIVRFIEWNWAGKQTGQLGTRDAVVNNIGSLLDPTKTGAAVPE